MTKFKDNLDGVYQNLSSNKRWKTESIKGYNISLFVKQQSK